MIFKRGLVLDLKYIISNLSYDQIARLLTTNYKYYRIDYLALFMNNAGGSLIQTLKIKDFLLNYKEKNGVKIYTYAESNCLNTSNILFQLGDKRIASIITRPILLYLRLFNQQFKNKHLRFPEIKGNTDKKI